MTQDPRTPPPADGTPDEPRNRAERRAKRRRETGDASPSGGGKVRAARFDHAPDPRRYAAHRRG